MNWPSGNTLSETMNLLKKEGYTADFNLAGNCIDCPGQGLSLSPQDFEVDKYYRFEGMSNPDDSAILYAISSPKYGVKGLLVNGYGIYSDEISDELMKKLTITY